MVTVSQLIEYLQALPENTEVYVAVNVECGYSSYVRFEHLELPGKQYPDCSDNLNFCDSGDNPYLEFGSK